LSSTENDEGSSLRVCQEEGIERDFQSPIPRNQELNHRSPKDQGHNAECYAVLTAYWNDLKPDEAPAGLEEPLLVARQ
jgi:hypothetical protein